MTNRPELVAEYERGRAAGQEASQRRITHGPLVAMNPEAYGYDEPRDRNPIFREGFGDGFTIA